MSSFQPWGNPDRSVAGLNSAMVYGENIQFTTGLNHRIALGSNLQLCVNPGSCSTFWRFPRFPHSPGHRTRREQPVRSDRT